MSAFLKQNGHHHLRNPDKDWEQNSLSSLEKNLTAPEIDPYAEDENHFKYWRALQTLKPIRFPKHKVPSPEDNAGLFSVATFYWLSNIMFKKEVGLEDLPPMSKYDTYKNSAERFSRLYKEDMEKHGTPSVQRTFYRFIRTRIIVGVILITISSLATLVGPTFLLLGLTNFTTSSPPDIGYGLSLAIGLLLVEVFRSLVTYTQTALSLRTAARIRSAIIFVIYQKVAGLQSMQRKTAGELVNFVTNDSQRIVEMVFFLGILLGSPIQIIASTVLCCLITGWTGIIGMVVIAAFLVLQFFLGSLLAKYREQRIVHTDSRLETIFEVLTYIQLIKMYVWENCFDKEIGIVRKTERKILSKSKMIETVMTAIFPVIPLIACVTELLVHTYLGLPLNAAQAFTTLSIFNTLRLLVATFPQAIKAVAEVCNAFKRIDDLLSMDEKEQFYITPEEKNIAIEFNNVTATWIPTSVDETSDVFDYSESDMTFQSRIDGVNGIDLTIKKGRLIGICGSTGSGKTSFISTIIGQLKIEEGSLALDGSIAYVPQQPWIFQDSARENILFGLPYDEKKYYRVVEVCNLKSDFESFSDKDLTEIGERGINISGGQKQRISIARAVYSERDIVLLDDPLSAVDASVGKAIFYECIKKYLADKTVIFVTHQLQYLKDCDEVILFKDGRVLEHECHTTLMKKNKEYSHLISNFNAENTKWKKTAKVNETVLQRVLEKQKQCKLFEQPPASPMFLRMRSTASQNRRSPRKFKRLHTTGTLEGRESLRKRRKSLARLALPNQTNEILLKRPRCRRNSTVLEALALNCAPEVPNIIHQSPKKMSNNKEAIKKKLSTLVSKEKEERESIKMSTYKAYIQEMGGPLVLFLLALVFMISVAAFNLTDWWLTLWINAGGALVNRTCTSNNNTTGTMTESCEEIRDPNITTNPELGRYQRYYSLILAVVLVSLILRSTLFVYTTLNTVSGFHAKSFKNIMQAPMSFFDTTPTGRILNRFSTDLGVIASPLPTRLELTTQFVLNLTAAIVTIAIVFPWFLIAVALMCIIFGYYYLNYRHSVKQLKSLENITRSPMISHLLSTVDGLHTIQAYGKKEQLMKTFGKLLDENNLVFHYYSCASNWVGFRLDIIGTLLIFVTALFVVFSTVYSKVLGSTTASYAGLALSYSLSLTLFLQYIARISIEAESYFTSVERINEYIIDIPSENKNRKNCIALPDSWPAPGKVECRNVSMRYREGLPLVLNSIDLTILPKEKIGIVGKSGSGKSTLGVALFRLVNLTLGDIIIDDVDISTISLHDLRRSISIIPQDPVLFVGTIRYNLDPFNESSDEDLWEALEKSYMKDTISQFPYQLNTEVVANGENFSVGERQLLCMARAILRDCRIIVLDEATAAIDSDTAQLVQDTILEAFSECTMLTIAHRINTVVTCDKILVMDDGKIVEFDRTEALLQNPKSRFASMVSAAGLVAKDQDNFSLSVKKAKK